MALPLHAPEEITHDRGWIVHSVFEPLPFSQAYLSTLHELSADPDCPGHSDVGVRNLLFTLIMSLKPEAVLEIGGHIGSAAVVMGEAMRLNNFGKLTSLEPQEHYFQKLSANVHKADLSQHVDVIRGFSYEDSIIRMLGERAPFEVIFLDACHDYQIVLEEITKYRDLLCENGVMVLHDASIHGQSFDSTKQGGVRKAILDAVDRFPDLKPIMLEYPLWLNNCGAALICKQRIANNKSFSKIISCLFGVK